MIKAAPHLKKGEVRFYHGDRGGSYLDSARNHLRVSKKIQVDASYVRMHQ